VIGSSFRFYVRPLTCRFLNAETQNINVPGMLFLPADGVHPAKLRDEGPKL